MGLRAGNFSRSFIHIILRTSLALAVFGLVLVGLVAAGSQTALAAPSPGINNEINFQGRLLSAAGAVVADGTYNMEFKIYKNGDGLALTDNTCTITDCQSTNGTLQWTEDWIGNAGHGVIVKNGYFSVNLGAVTTLAGIDLDQPVLWLSMNVGNTTGSSCTPFSSCSPDNEMLPMKRISSSVYALTSGSCTSCILQAPTSTAQNTITPATSGVVGLTVNGTNTGTAAAAININQAFAADGEDLNYTTAANTAFNVTANSLTTGTGISVSSSGAGQTSATLLNVAQSGVTTGFTGNVVNVQGTSTTGGGNLVNLSSANTTAGTALNVTANALTTGKAVVISSAAAAQTSAQLLTVTQSGTTTGFTGNVVSFTGSSTTGSGNLLALTSVNTTAGSALNVTANALTTGNAVTIGSSSATQTSATLLNVVQSGVTTGYTGNVVNIQGTSTTGGGSLLNLNSANTTIGDALKVTANALTSGNGVDISSSNASQTSAVLLNVTQSGVTTGYTGNVVNIQGTSTTGGGHLLNLASANTTVGDALSVTANSLTTGNAVDIASASAGQTNATLLNVVQSGVTTGFTGNVVNLQGSSTTGGGSLLNLAYSNTTAGNALNITANSATTGNAEQISATALTSGSALTINAGSGKALTITGGTTQLQTSTNSTTAFQIQDAGGVQLFNADTTDPNSTITDITNNANDNLVANGSFEINSTGWAKMGATQAAVTQDSGQQYIGNDSLKMVTNATDGAGTDGAKYALTTSTLVSNTKYSLKIYARTTAGASWATMEIGHADNGATNTSCLTAQAVLSTGWTQYSCTFTTGTTSSTPYIYIRQTDAVARTFWVDAVQLTRWSSLGNASVDIAATTLPWAKKTGSETTVAQSATQAEDGADSLHIVTTAAVNQGTKQAITLNDSTTYSLTFWAYLTSGTFTDMEAGYSSDGSTDNTVCVTGQSLTLTTWVQYSCTFTTPSSHSGTPYFYVKQAAATSHDFYIDALQLTNGNPLSAYKEGQLQVNAVINSPVALQNASDSTTAFMVQDTSGANLIDADTANDQVTLLQNARVSTFVEAGNIQDYAITLADNINSPNEAVRWRINNSGANLESGGTDIWLSGWTGANFTGTQDFFLRGDLATGNLYVGDAAAHASPELVVVGLKNTTGDVATEYDGGIYYNQADHGFRCGVHGSWENCTGLTTAYTATVGPFSNDTAEHSFGQTFSIPQNDCQPGTVYHITAGGHATSAAAGHLLTFSLQDKNLSSGVTTDLISAGPTNGTDSTWNVDLTITCRTTTSIFTVGNAFVQYAGGTPGTSNYNTFSSSVGETISNSAAGDQFGLSVQWGTAPGSGDGAYEYVFDVDRLGAP